MHATYDADDTERRQTSQTDTQPNNTAVEYPPTTAVY